jgi:hypothetical protein
MQVVYGILFKQLFIMDMALPAAPTSSSTKKFSNKSTRKSLGRGKDNSNSNHSAFTEEGRRR